MENNIIELTQAPVIEYSGIDAIANEVAKRMNDLDLDNIVATEDNFKDIKKIRSTLNAEHKMYEEKRKLIKDMCLKPYEDFLQEYDDKIGKYYKGADAKLKTKIDLVTDDLLVQKIDAHKLYFDENNKFDFVDFESMNLHITNSKADKAIQEEINAFLEQVKIDIATIKTLPNDERVLAKYQRTLDLNKSISEVNIDIANEERIAKEKEQQAEIVQPEKEVIQEVVEKTIQEEVREVEQPQLVSTSFKVTATLDQLKALKQYMELNNIKVEVL